MRLTIIVVLAFLPGRAAADDAKTHVDAGVKAYSANDYETASREFELAYSLEPAPKVLFAWAQARRLGGHCTAALGLYRRYLATKLTDEQIAAATTGITLCEQTQPVQAPAPPPDQPPPAPQLIAPRSEQPRRWYNDKLGGALTIGGVAVTSVGITYLVLSNRSKAAADRAPVRDDFIELLDESTTRRRIGVIALAAGSAIVIGGIIRYVTQRDEPATLTVGTSGTSVVLFGRF